MFNYKRRPSISVNNRPTQQYRSTQGKPTYSAVWMAVDTNTVLLSCKRFRQKFVAHKVTRNTNIAVRWPKSCHTATGIHVPYGITQWHSVTCHPAEMTFEPLGSNSRIVGTTRSDSWEAATVDFQFTYLLTYSDQSYNASTPSRPTRVGPGAIWHCADVGRSHTTSHTHSKRLSQHDASWRWPTETSLCLKQKHAQRFNRMRIVQGEEYKEKQPPKSNANVYRFVRYLLRRHRIRGAKYWD